MAAYRGNVMINCVIFGQPFFDKPGCQAELCLIIDIHIFGNHAA